MRIDWPKPSFRDGGVLLETTTQSSHFGSFMSSGRWLYTSVLCGMGEVARWSLAETRTQGSHTYTSYSAMESWEDSSDGV